MSKLPATPFLIILWVLILCSCKDSETQPVEIKTQAPNIILILADDLGYGDIEAFNPNGKIPTPHLNRLANEGILFTDAHTSSSVCTPTRYGILTGRYNWRSPIKSGVLYGRDSALIHPQTTTIPMVLKRAGYQTGFIGKWHLGWDWVLDENHNIDFSKPITSGPNDLGFDYAYGHVASLDMPPYVYVENRFATSIPDSIIPATKGYPFYREGWIAPDFEMEEVTPHFFDKSLQFIENSRNHKQPFFLYLALPSPHTPILPVSEWQGKSGINPYADFVMQIDHHIGQMIKQLDSMGLSDETMVLFTSDNGCSPMANFERLAEENHHPSAEFRGYKADIYEGGHRVPLIIKYPPLITPGSHSDSIISTTDFFASLAQIARMSVSENEGVDSYSILPLFSDSIPDTYQRKTTIHSSINGSFAIRRNEWKLILCPGSGGWSFPRPQKARDLELPPIQLYNLSDDPSETTNVFSDHPRIVADLYRSLVQTIDRGRSTPGPILPNDPNGFDDEWETRNALLLLNEFITDLESTSVTNGL